VHWTIWMALAAGVAALVFAWTRAVWVGKQDSGTEEMRTISLAIREGAMAYLGRQYRMLGIFVAVVAVLLGIGYGLQLGTKALIAVSFILGAGCSGLAGFFGMRVATRANVRTTNAARTSLSKALGVAFNGGAVMGMSVVGLALTGLAGLFVLYWFVFDAGADRADGMGNLGLLLQVLAGFSLGASSIALFARVGGGIYTKAADVGADLVGKVEAGIPEDDPRNPATIADNVGDNVGDVAGMGADLAESYIGAIISAMILATTWALASGTATTADLGPVFLPMALAAVGIIASIIGTFLVRAREDTSPHKALNIGTFVAAGLMTVGTFFVTRMMLPESVRISEDQVFTPLGVFAAVVGGLVAGTAIGLVTEYYTSDHGKPARGIAKNSLTGPATNIISGLAVGMQSTAIPILLLGGAILLAYEVAGLYGIALAGLGMLSTTGIQLAVDAYGPIADNAGGIAEMSHLPKEVRQRTDKLDAVGNTTAAIGKGFAIGSAALTALALFSAYQTSMPELTTLNLLEPRVMVGVLLGAMMAFLFSSMSMNAVSRAASGMVDEVRRQFREIPGLLEGTGRADYGRCVDISTKAALREMVAPGLLAVLVPVIVGFADPSGNLLGGLLAGVTAGGVLLALFMANSGGAWDNAKKYIEGGAHGGKGSDAHKAAVVGDTVGDPFKDTAGPSLNILMKLMSVVALVLAPILASL
jgi:K(+)-stimulated pyrophosphate-energized sodium pump